MRVFKLLAAVLALILTAGAADNKKGDFRPLFNGKDLTGWHKNPQKIGHGTGGSWTVENRVIVGQQDPPGSGNGGILLTDQKFGNFEVMLEVDPDWGPDSGLFLRSNDQGQAYQVMIDYHPKGNVGEIYREGLDGKGNRSFDLEGEAEAANPLRLKTLKAVPSSGRQPNFKPEDWNKIWKINGWNTIRARIEGNPPTIETWINGHFITKYTSDQKFEDKIADTGSIAVQVHGGKSAWPANGKIRFRNIRVKEF